MEVKVLVEDTAKNGMACEHGLSIWITYKGNHYLVDTGATDLYTENARKMGLNLAEVEGVFLSHAHYDHSGGFLPFFKANEKAGVYLQKSAGYCRCYKIVGDMKKYIGIPSEVLENYENRMIYVDGYRSLGNGIHILPHTTKELSLRGKRAHMYVEKNGQIHIDDFSHEQTIVFEEEDGLVLFNSCSHGGVENIVKEVNQKFPDKKIKAFFGGFHMMGPDGVCTCQFEKEEVQKVAEELNRLEGTVFYSGHCTGQIAFEWLREIMGDRMTALYSGMEIQL
ncbi:MAG: MBL fold metallo-hydrolase [Clostridiales bacterium]|nr:MBL fold metallo-hydrolase [Clostridiales bacterium]